MVNRVHQGTAAGVLTSFRVECRRTLSDYRVDRRINPGIIFFLWRSLKPFEFAWPGANITSAGDGDILADVCCILKLQFIMHLSIVNTNFRLIFCKKSTIIWCYAANNVCVWLSINKDINKDKILVLKMHCKNWCTHLNINKISEQCHSNLNVIQ